MLAQHGATFIRKKRQILKVKDKTEILAKLKEPSLLSLEFAYVYVDPDASDQLQGNPKYFHLI